MTFAWTLPAPLDATAKTLSIYIVELQAIVNFRRSEIGQGPFSFIDQSVGKQYLLSAVEELKTVTNQAALDFGYAGGVENVDLLGRAYASYGLKYGQFITSYPILNDLRLVLDLMVYAIGNETWLNPETFNKVYNNDVNVVMSGITNHDESEVSADTVIGDWGEWVLGTERRTRASAASASYGGAANLICNGTFSKTNHVQGSQNSGLVLSINDDTYSLNSYADSRNSMELSNVVSAYVPKKFAIEVRNVSVSLSHNMSFVPQSGYPGGYPGAYSVGIIFRIRINGFSWRRQYTEIRVGAFPPSITDINQITSTLSTGLITLPAAGMYAIAANMEMDVNVQAGKLYVKSVTAQGSLNASMGEIAIVDMT